MFLTSITSLVQKQPQGGNSGGQPNTAIAGQQSAAGPAMMSTGVPSTNAMPVSIQSNNASGSGRMNLTIPPGTDPKQINELLGHARYSAEELRRQGVSEHMIAIVERNRAILEASLRTQQNFHGSLAKQQQVGASSNVGTLHGAQGGTMFPKTPQIQPAQGLPTASPAQQPMPAQGPLRQTPGLVQPQSTQPQQPQPAHSITKPSVAVVNGQSPTAEEMRQVSQWLEAIRQIFMHNRSTFLWQWDAVCGLTCAC